MNAFATFSGLILMCLAKELIAVCPAGRDYIGPCVGSSCPQGNYCNVNKDGASGDCCSGAEPIVVTAAPCVDQLSDCPKNVALCNVDSYRVFMTAKCPKTCNRCVVTNCTDANTLCTQWAAQGFCQSSFYTTAHKQTYCRATCGYC
uniref:ShKT domain-containing protein n=1 Tax=Plectus sambesii TaxID=2011161 RepID=A0A914UMG3_9BILA